MLKLSSDLPLPKSWKLFRRDEALFTLRLKNRRGLDLEYSFVTAERVRWSLSYMSPKAILPMDWEA